MPCVLSGKLLQNTKHSILISGGGGDLAWSILRSLQASGHTFRFVGMDFNPDAIGVDFFDEFYLVPPVGSADYPSALEAICCREHARLLYPASDAELAPLAGLSEWLFQRTGTRTIVHPPPLVGLLRDKLETNRFLVGHGLPAPATLELDSAQEGELQDFIAQRHWPLIIKPAISHGSRGTHIVENLEEIQFFRHRLDRPILQEHIGTPESEYTCGVYVTSGDQVRVLSLRRKLFGGVTGIAEKVESSEIADYCRSVVLALDARGSLNIQLRVGERGPLLFEINPRFSSTACIRARFGFNDVLWALEESLYGTVSPYEATGESFCFRYFQEYYCQSHRQRRLPNQLFALKESKLN
jgi:carbamoyl-phosphate synthase large subunit